MPAKDSLFASPLGEIDRFKFNQAVVDVFPDMLRRSVPGYESIITQSALLASRYVQPNTHLYDLGSSLGATAISMRDALMSVDPMLSQGCEIHAIDNSADMVEASRRVIAESLRDFTMTEESAAASPERGNSEYSVSARVNTLEQDQDYLSKRVDSSNLHHSSQSTRVESPDLSHDSKSTHVDSPELGHGSQSARADSSDLHRGSQSTRVESPDLHHGSQSARADSPDLHHGSQSARVESPDLHHGSQSARADSPDLHHGSQSARTDSPDLHHGSQSARADSPDLQSGVPSTYIDSPANRVTPIFVHEADLESHPLENASVVAMNFTLQFVDVHARAALMKKIADALQPGGVFILSEKVCFSDPVVNEMHIDMYHAFKSANGYSDLEISQKRTALENVLVPDTLSTHHERLLEAGFTRASVWFQCFNFASLVAIR